jgi:hypothetical protein
MINTLKEILMKCDFWLNSIKQARSEIEAKHGDFAELVSNSEFRIREEEGSFIFDMNIEAQTLWNLYDQLVKMADDFVADQMNLHANSYLFYFFGDLWKECGFPEAMQNDEDCIEEVPQTDTRQSKKIWAERKVVRERGKYRIVDSVHWFHGSFEPGDVAKLLLKAKCSMTVDSMVLKAKRGRPQLQKDSILYPQAVICAILKDKQGLTIKEIASIFGWKLQKDTYENMTICNTASQRIKLGRKIIGSKGKIPTNN